MADLKSPKKGCVIIGTYELVYGTALIQDAKINDDRIDFEYEGSTDVDWDSQKTVREGGRRVFVDDDHNTWTEDEVIAANK